MKYFPLENLTIWLATGMPDYANQNDLSENFNPTLRL